MYKQGDKVLIEVSVVNAMDRGNIVLEANGGHFTLAEGQIDACRPKTAAAKKPAKKKARR